MAEWSMRWAAGLGWAKLLFSALAISVRLVVVSVRTRVTIDEHEQGDE